MPPTHHHRDLIIRAVSPLGKVRSEHLHGEFVMLAGKWWLD